MQNAIHAAPKGAWPSIRGGRYYKYGAPNGAGNIFVAEDTYKVQAGGGRTPKPGGTVDARDGRDSVSESGFIPLRSLRSLPLVHGFGIEQEETEITEN